MNCPNLQKVAIIRSVPAATSPAVAPASVEREPPHLMDTHCVADVLAMVDDCPVVKGPKDGGVIDLNDDPAL